MTMQEFAPRQRILAKFAEHHRRHHTDARFVHTARRHALMRGFDDDAYAFRLQHGLDAMGDLGVHLLLHLQAARKCFHHARELGNADHLVVRQIAHMHAANDGR